MAEQGRYSKLSEEEAAAQFELRKQQLLGGLLEQYQSANNQKNKKPSKSQQQNKQQEFVIFNPKKQKKILNKPIKKLEFVHDTPNQSNEQLYNQEQQESSDLINEQQEIIQQHVEPTPQVQSPLVIEKKDIKKMLLRDIGNLDLEIQRLTKETKEYSIQKPLNRSLPITKPSSSQPSQHLKESKELKESNLKQSRPTSQQPQQSKAYYELRQRPSSKESRISEASYTKKAECFKGVIRSASLKKLSQGPPKPFSNYFSLRGGSERKINQSVNNTKTIESENKEQVNKVVQSERKIPKPMIQISRSQSKQDTPTYEKKAGTPVKSILKVQFNQIDNNSTKNNSSTFFHNHKESFNSQASLGKTRCVEAQIEEAVQLYNNLKSLMQNKASVLQLRKDGNLIPRKTADFFYHKAL